MLESGHIVIGTPDDAVAVLKKLHAKQGDFGAFLHQCNDWADWPETKRSYELYARFVRPHFTNANVNRVASLDNWKQCSVELSAVSHAAAKATFEQYGAPGELENAQKIGMIGAKKSA
jgi:limonene 1,2-monooxygenase